MEKENRPKKSLKARGRGRYRHHQEIKDFLHRLRRGGFLWYFVRRFDHVFEKFFEILQPGGRDDDGVASPADIFSDAQEPAARIFLER